MKTPQNPQIHFCTVGSGSTETHLSLWYIRDIALKALGKIQTETIPMSQHDTRYHVTMPWVEFNIGEIPNQTDKWRNGSACNSESSAEALGNYFLHLRDACAIRKAGKDFKWSNTEGRFVEIKWL